MGNEDSAIKTASMLPLSCPAGHQVYVVWFPMLDSFGFSCGICHKLGSSITHGEKVLIICESVLPSGYRPSLREDLLLGMEVKSAHICCSRKHFLMVVEFPEFGTFGFGCIHCKSYSHEAQNNGINIEVRVMRELIKSDARRIITEHPAFTKPN